MKIAAWPNQSGSRYWRLEDPFVYLRKRGHEAHVVIDEPINDEICSWTDIIVLQSTVDKEGIACAYAYQQTRGKKIVVDADDLLELTEDNPYKIEHKITNATEIIKKTMTIADLITCTTPYLQAKLQEINKNVIVLPNYMDLRRWDLPIYKNDSQEVRIGWAGSMTHTNDIKMVMKPLKKIMEEYKQVKLILFGDPRLGELFKGVNTEVIPGVPFDSYPARLHGLRLDIGIAPLEDTAFNRGKTNIKFLEYSICKVPTIVSPTVYGLTTKGYADIAPNEEEWYQKLKRLIEDKDLRESIGRKAYSHVKFSYDLEKHIKEWEKAYSALLT